MGRPGRFRASTRFRSSAGLAPRASQAGESGRKGQPMSKAGPAALRAALFRAAGTARRQDPQLARVCGQQMTERGANHPKASCAVAGHLPERAWMVLNHGTPHGVRDGTGQPVTAQQARQIIAGKRAVPEEARKRRRSQAAGKALRRPQPGRACEATLPAPDPPPAPRPSSPPPPNSPSRHHRTSAPRPPPPHRPGQSSMPKPGPEDPALR